MKFNIYAHVRGEKINETIMDTREFSNGTDFFNACIAATCEIHTNILSDVYGKINSKKAWSEKFKKVSVYIYLPNRTCVDVKYIKTKKDITEFHLANKCISDEDIINGFKFFVQKADKKKYDKLNKEFDHVVYFPNATVRVFFANSLSDKRDEDFFIDRKCEITRETISIPTYGLENLNEGDIPVVFNYGDDLMVKFLELLPDTEMMCQIASFESDWEKYMVNEQGITPEFWGVQNAITDTRLNDDIVDGYFELACIQGKYCVDICADISERLESDKPYKDWNDFVDNSIALTIENEQELNQGEFMRLDYNEVSKSLHKEFYMTKKGYVFKL